MQNCAFRFGRCICYQWFLRDAWIEFNETSHNDSTTLQCWSLAIAPVKSDKHRLKLVDLSIYIELQRFTCNSNKHYLAYEVHMIDNAFF